jgi:hypothetical protein
VSKSNYVELRTRATMREGATFLPSVIAASSLALNTVLTDNRSTFADAPR